MPRTLDDIISDVVEDLTRTRMAAIEALATEAFLLTEPASRNRLVMIATADLDIMPAFACVVGTAAWRHLPWRKPQP